MDKYILFPPPDYNLVWEITREILRRIPVTPVLYLGAAVIARLAHRYVWLIYLALATAALMSWNH